MTGGGFVCGSGAIVTLRIIRNRDAYFTAAEEVRFRRRSDFRTFPRAISLIRSRTNRYDQDV
jgi:hypothetical protein